MQRLDQAGRLFLPVFYHLVHSNMQCLLTSSPFALVYLQNSPKSSCGMEHPQTNSWRVPGRKKITVQTTSSAKSLLFAGVLTLFLSQSLWLSLSWSHCFIPSNPLGIQGLSAALSNTEHVTHPLHYLYWLLTSWFLFFLKFPSVGSGSLSKSPPFHHVLMDICSLGTSVLNGPC